MQESTLQAFLAELEEIKKQASAQMMYRMVSPAAKGARRSITRKKTSGGGIFDAIKKLVKKKPKPVVYGTYGK